MTQPSGHTLRNCLLILVASSAVGFLYNAFSPKGLPLIRIEPIKVAVADSVLFSAPQKKDTVELSPVEKKKDSVKSVMNERIHPGLTGNAKTPIEKKLVYKIISLTQLQRLMNENRGILIDARGKDEFDRGHIAGARSIPYLEAEDHFEEMISLPRDSLILIYCTNPECHLGRGLAEFMSVMEFKQILLYDDGWDGWMKAGLPVATSRDSVK